MSLGTDIGQILKQYSGSQMQAPSRVEDDFDQVSQASDPSELQDGLSEAFRSDQTPPFGNMVGQLFGNADTGQRTGMLNHLLAGIGPAAISGLLGGRAGGMLGALLGSLGGGQQQQPQISEDQAQQLSPEDVEELAQNAERENPGIIDHMSRFYANNPALVKSLGGVALAIALGKMARRSN